MSQEPTSCPLCGGLSRSGMFYAPDAGVHWWECNECDIRFIGCGPSNPYKVHIEERRTGRRYTR